MEKITSILAIICTTVYIGYLIFKKELSIEQYKLAAIVGWILVLIGNIISLFL